jgi:hypothetical protein
MSRGAADVRLALVWNAMASIQGDELRQQEQIQMSIGVAVIDSGWEGLGNFSEEERGGQSVDRGRGRMRSCTYDQEEARLRGIYPAIRPQLGGT